MKAFYCLLLLLCPYVSYCQYGKGLSIGDRLPPVLLKQVLNHKSNSILVSDRDRPALLLIDFMYSTCGSCVRTLASLQSLQPNYGNQLEVLVVTPQPKAVVQKFLQSKPGKALSFPFIVADTLLHRMFPHQYVSHIVWVTRDGLVKAITGAEYATEENIQQVIAGKPVSWPVKRDQPEFDFSQPMMQASEQMQGLEKGPIFTSSLFPYLPGVRPYLDRKTDSLSGNSRFLFINMSLPQMLTRLYQKWEFANSRVLLAPGSAVASDLQSRMAYRRNWNERNLFCYEALMAWETASAVQTGRIFQDIQNKFGVKAAFRIDSVECLIVHEGSSPGSSSPPIDHAVSLWHAITALNERFSGKPIIDSVPNSHRLFLPLAKTSLGNDTLLLQTMRQAGYELRPAKLSMELLFIQQNFNQPN